MGQLSAQHISKHYGQKSILDDVSLVVNHGEIVGLLGPNGAGKTTCFNVIVGLVRPDAGAIRMLDEDLSSLSIHLRARRGLAYLPQERSIFPDLTAQENVQAFLEIHQKAPAKVLAEQAVKLLDDLHIAHLAGTRAALLSGGEMRRVEIARLLAVAPQFVLMDEPFAAISPIAIKDIKNIVVDLAARGIGILITDHNVREALNICQRAYILHNGSVLVEGTPQHIINNPEARQFFLGKDYTQ